MKHSLTLALLLAGCGGGGTGAPAPATLAALPAPEHLTVAPGVQAQHTDSGKEIWVLPYRTLPAAPPPTEADYVYVRDELGWNDPVPEPNVAAYARAMQAMGHRTMITILPEIILRPGFHLSDPQAYTDIGIDIYPSLGIDWNTQGCTYSPNLYTTMLKCGIDGLRAAGFTGRVWYVYQDFNLSDPRLASQAETIAAAPGLGVTATVAYRF